MQFFGMGPMEMLVIMAVALIIFGPGKLPEIAQTIGKSIREFRAATNELTGEFQRTINEVTDEVGSFTGEVKGSVTEVQQTAMSVTRLDQIDSPASAPAKPNPAASVQGGASRPAAQPQAVRMPTKADPLADLMPTDLSASTSANGAEAEPTKTV